MLGSDVIAIYHSIIVIAIKDAITVTISIQFNHLFQKQEK